LGAAILLPQKEVDLAMRRFVETPLINTTDILSVCKKENGWVVKVQTTGNDVVQCMNAVTGKVEPIKFDEPGVHEVFVNE